MLLILALVASSMFCPAEAEGEMDSNFDVCIAGYVTWNESGFEDYAVITIVIDEQVLRDYVYESGGSYKIHIGQENQFEQGDEFTVTCSIVDGTPPYPVTMRNVIWQDDFQFQYPEKVWVGMCSFLLQS